MFPTFRNRGGAFFSKMRLERDLYWVRYYGFVTLGTDERIAFDKNDVEKIIRVRVPDSKVLDLEVDFDKEYGKYYKGTAKTGV